MKDSTSLAIKAFSEPSALIPNDCGRIRQMRSVRVREGPVVATRLAKQHCRVLSKEFANSFNLIQKMYALDTRCSVCCCKLPLNRHGHVERATRKAHNQGAKHQAQLSAIAREKIEASERRYAQFCAEQAAARKQARQERRLAVALGVLATRLRARHGSMEAARAAWAEAADATLQSVELPELRLKLHGPTEETLAWREMQTIVAVEDHQLLRFLFGELGLGEE